jgi:hypothetical protein
MSKKVIASVVAIVLVIGAFTSYEFFSYQTFKNQCLSNVTRNGRTITISFDNSANTKVFTAFENELGKMNNVENVQLTTADEALAHYKQVEAGNIQPPDILSYLNADSFGPTITITFSNFDALVTSQDAVIQQIKALLSHNNLSQGKLGYNITGTSRLVGSYSKVSFLQAVFSGHYNDTKDSFKQCAGNWGQN